MSTSMLYLEAGSNKVTGFISNYKDKTDGRSVTVGDSFNASIPFRAYNDKAYIADLTYTVMRVRGDSVDVEAVLNEPVDTLPSFA